MKFSASEVRYVASAGGNTPDAIKMLEAFAELLEAFEEVEFEENNKIITVGDKTYFLDLTKIKRKGLED